MKMVTSSIVKVSFMKVTWSLTSELKCYKRLSLCKGEQDDNEDVERRDNHYDGPVDSDGKPHETYPEN